MNEKQYESKEDVIERLRVSDSLTPKLCKPENIYKIEVIGEFPEE